MEWTTIVVALLSLLGTGIGTWGGIRQANRLTNYRIEQLEERVNKHNNLIERMIAVEDRSKSNQHRLDEIEKHIETLHPRA